MLQAACVSVYAKGWPDILMAIFAATVSDLGVPGRGT